MNCERVRGLLSELAEGRDSASVRAAREHILACTGCAEELERFERAVGALRHHGSRETQPRVKQAVLAAVDAAAREDARAEDDEFRRASLLAAARFERGTRRRRIATHVVALLAGAAAVLLWFALAPRSEPVPMEVAAPRIEVVDRLVEVPVVELRRVLVEVDRPVVQFVDRPIEVEVVRTVRRGPLLALDLSGLSEAVADAAHSLGEAARVRALAPNVEPEPAFLASVSEPARRPGVTSIRLRHSGPNITLETFGSLSEVVPVLLSRLEDPEGAVVALVERRLTAIRDAAASDPEIAARLQPLRGDAPTGRRNAFRLFDSGDEPAETTTSERWSAWWGENGALIAEAERKGTL